VSPKRKAKKRVIVKGIAERILALMKEGVSDHSLFEINKAVMGKKFLIKHEDWDVIVRLISTIDWCWVNDLEQDLKCNLKSEYKHFYEKTMPSINKQIDKAERLKKLRREVKKKRGEYLK